MEKPKPFKRPPSVIKFLGALEDDIHPDILNRLDDGEGGNIKVYLSGRIEKILNDPEDDTSETCKYLLGELYKKMAEEEAVGIIICCEEGKK